MRKIMMAVAALALSGGAAWGQSASQDISLQATVGGYCTINGGATGGALGTTAIATANAKATVATHTFNINQIQCTSSLKVMLTSNSGGLLNLAGASQATGTFVNKIHYSATAKFGAETLAIVDTSTTTSPTAVATVSGLYGTPTTAQTLSSATIAVDVTVQPTGANFLVNGNYLDTLVVTLTPNF